MIALTEAGRISKIFQREVLTTRQEKKLKKILMGGAQEKDCDIDDILLECEVDEKLTSYYASLSRSKPINDQDKK